MGGFKVEIFDEQGFIRNWNVGWSIYAAFAPTGDGRAMVKVGNSSKVYERILALRTGCPFPIEMVLWTMVEDRATACRLESSLHRSFSERRTNGEWFEFDLKSSADKELFHSETKRLHMLLTKKSLTWKKISEEQLKVFANLQKDSV